jgi:tetratricopeptide (TPR) repeat protein
MSETLEYIDTYFNGGLAPTEKEAFEIKCESDPAFAEEVAFYISARAGLKNTLHEQKKEEFRKMYAELSAKNNTSSKGTVRKMFPYMAAVAACLLVFFGYQIFFSESSSQASSKQLAEAYVKQNMLQLNITMGGEKDSLQLGIAAFNSKQYNEAEKIFAVLTNRPSTSAEAVKNLGTVYLVTGRFDDAVTQFDKLASQPDLFVNPGLFYKAIALLQRSAPGDKESAKQLLEEVVKKDLPGSKEAKEWLQKL